MLGIACCFKHYLAEFFSSSIRSYLQATGCYYTEFD